MCCFLPVWTKLLYVRTLRATQLHSHPSMHHLGLKRRQLLPLFSQLLYCVIGPIKMHLLASRPACIVGQLWKPMYCVWRSHQMIMLRLEPAALASAP